MIYYKSVQIIIDALRLPQLDCQRLRQSSPPSSIARGTTFKLGYGYTPLSSTVVTVHTSLMRTSNRNLMTACYKNLPHGLNVANRFPSDLWGYVHGFGHQPESLVAPLTYYDLLKLWQISFRRTLWGFEHRFGHKLGIKSKFPAYDKGVKSRGYALAIILICDVFHILLLEHNY